MISRESNHSRGCTDRRKRAGVLDLNGCYGGALTGVEGLSRRLESYFVRSSCLDLRGDESTQEEGEACD